MADHTARSGLRPFSRITAAILLLSQSACATVRTVDASFLTAENPGRVQITLADGRELEVQQPRVIADTVFGFNGMGEEVMAPLAQVQQVRVRRINTARTAALGLALLGLSVALAKIFSGLEGENPRYEETEDVIVPVRR